MTKKDYKHFADMIYRARRDNLSLDAFVDKFVDHLKYDNPRFCTDKFMEACGFEFAKVGK